MNATARATAAPAVATGWLVLTLDALQLSLPQRSVRQIELIGDLRPADGLAPGPAAWLERADGRSWPAYCLDGALDPVTRVPDTRRVAVFFDAGDAVCGLLCDRVTSFASDAELAVEPLPGCMTGLPSPLTGVAHLGDGIVAVTDGAALFTYLTGAAEADRG
jgi:hypothetical protein